MPPDVITDTAVAPTPSDACTTACTSSPKTTNLDTLAAALLALAPDERAKLASLLAAPTPKGE